MRTHTEQERKRQREWEGERQIFLIHLLIIRVSLSAITNILIRSGNRHKIAMAMLAEAKNLKLHLVSLIWAAVSQVLQPSCFCLPGGWFGSRLRGTQVCLGCWCPKLLLHPQCHNICLSLLFYSMTSQTHSMHRTCALSKRKTCWHCLIENQLGKVRISFSYTTLWSLHTRRSCHISCRH